MKLLYTPHPSVDGQCYYVVCLRRLALSRHYDCDRGGPNDLPTPASLHMDTQINVESLRALKNSVIGNPSAKTSLAQDEPFVRVSVSNSLKQRPVMKVDDLRSLTPVSLVV